MEQALRTRSNIKKNETLWEVYDGIAFTVQENKGKETSTARDKICQESHGEAEILPEEKGSEQGKHAREEML